MRLMRGDIGTTLWIPEFRSRHADLKAATVVSSLLAIAQFKLPYVASVTPLYENLLGQSYLTIANSGNFVKNCCLFSDLLVVAQHDIEIAL
jgi:hypothetical protein